MWITSLNLRNKGEAPHLALVNIPVPAQRRTFDITLYCKQTSKLPKYVLKESKNFILYEVFETTWTRMCTCQMVTLRPCK